MNILTANLKHIYQRRINWLAIFMLSLTAYVIVAVTFTLQAPVSKTLGMPLIWIMFTGMYISSMAAEVINKPMSYCMPGHRSVPRNFLFACGLTLSALWSICYINIQPQMILSQTLISCTAAFALLTTLYWLTVLSLILINIPVLTILIVAGLPIIDYNNGPLSYLAIVIYPYTLIIIGIIINLTAWQLLSRDSIARKYCGKAIDGLTANPDKIRREKLLRRQLKGKDSRDNISWFIEGYFTRKLSNTKNNSSRQFIIGGIYSSLAMPLSKLLSIKGLLTLLIVGATIGYLPGAKHVIMIIIAMTAARVNLNIDSTHLTAGGRKERFRAALIIATLSAILTLIVGTIIAGLNYILIDTLPDKIHIFRNIYLKYNDVILGWIMMTAVIPIALFTKLLTRKHHLLSLLTNLLIVVFSLVAIVIIHDTYKLPEIFRNDTLSLSSYKNIFKPFPYIAAAQWLLFIIALKVICTESYKICNRILLGCAAVLLFFALKLTYYATVTPVADIDYVKIYNQNRIPENFTQANNSFPIYQQLENIISPIPDTFRNYNKDIFPDSEVIEQYRLWTKANSQALTTIESAVELPYYYIERKADNGAFFVQLPDLSNMRNIFYLLYCSTIVNIADGNTTQAIQHIDSINKMANQLWSENSLLIEQIVTISYRSKAAVLSRMLLKNSNPNSANLETLTSIINSMADTPMTISYAGSNLYFYDTLQRSFSPSKNGSGHLAWHGLLTTETKDRRPEIRNKFAMAHISMFGPSEKQIINANEQIMKLLDQSKQLTPFEYEYTDTNARIEINKIILSNDIMRNQCGYYSRMRDITYNGISEIQATATIIAIKKYQLANNKLPDSLQTLQTSGYIDQIPTDPYSDTTLIYKTTDNDFILYSYGDDMTNNNATWQDRLYWPSQPQKPTYK